MTLGLLLAFAGVAVADIIQADADGDTVAVSSNESLTLQPGASVVRNISFQLVCGDPSTGANSQPNQRHVESNQSISIASNSFSFPAGGAFALDPTVTTDDTTTIASSIASSTPWPADNISCADFLANNPGSLTPRQDSGNISVKITAPLQAGTYTYTANFEATESPAGSDDQQDLANTTIAQNPAVKKLVQATYIVTVPSNTAPTVPGAPTTNSNPNQGAFTLDWTASTDAQSNPITYELQHKDANDPGYTTVTGAGSLNTNSYTSAVATLPKLRAPGPTR